MAQSRSAKAMILASGQGLTTLVGLVIAAVLARLFSKHDYATYRQTLLAYTFAAPFVMLGFDRALYYFLPNQKERSRGVLIENLLLLVTGGILLGLFLTAGGNELLARRFRNPDLATTLLILAPYPLLMLPAASLGACLLARDRAGQVAIFNVTSRLLMLLAVVVPCLIWPLPAIAIVGVVCGAALSTTLALGLMFRACPTGNWRPTLAGLRRQFLYSIPLGLAGLAGAIRLGLDQVMVSALCSPESFAVFAIGATRVPLIAVFTGSVTSVLLVDYTRLYREGRTAEIIDLLHRAMIKCALVLIPAMVFLLCVAPEFMRVVFGRQYEESANIFRVYLLLLPLSSVSAGALIMATGKSHHVLIQSILGLVTNAIVTYFFVRAWGPIGAAIATFLVANCLGAPYFLLVLSSIVRCPARRVYPWLDLLKVLLASALPGVPFAFLKSRVDLPDVGILALGSVLYASATIALFHWLRLVSVSQLLGTLYALCRRRPPAK